LEALEDGSVTEQYAALIGLREHDYIAFAEGYGATLLYRISGPCPERIIRPKQTPQDPS